MANNVTLSAGTLDGAVIATDDIGSIHFQYQKVGIGADDTFTILVGDSGNKSAGTLRVVLATDQPALTNKLLVTPDLPSGAATSAKQDTEITALQIIDNLVAAMYVDDADWTDDTSSHFLTGGVYQATPHTVTDGDVTPFLTDANGRLAVAVNGTVAVSNAGLAELAAAINASSQMDVNVAANGIGLLTTVAHDAAFGTAGTADAQVRSIQGIASMTPVQVSQATAATLNMTEASAAGILTAVQLIDDPVATLGTTTYTETTTKGMIVGAVRRDADTTLVDTTNEVGPLQMDANGRLKVEAFSGETLPVSLSGVSTLAEQQTQTTALQLIDDVVYTDDTSTHATGTSKGVGIMGAAVPTDTSISANDIGMVGMTTDRRLYVEASIAATQTLSTVTTVSTVSALGTGTTGPMKAEDVGHSTGDMGIPAWGVRQDSPNATAAASGDYHYLATDMVGGIRTALYETDFAVLGTTHVKKYYTNSGSVTDGIIWSPAAGKRWYVTDIFLQISAAATVTLEDDKAGGDEAIWKAELAANSGWSHSFATPWFSGEDAADLIITTTAGNVYVTVTGYEI